MAHFLEMLADSRVSVEYLITHRFPIDRAVEAYELILEGKEPCLGVVMQYPEQPELSRTVEVHSPQRTQRAQSNKINFLKTSAPSASSAVKPPVSIGLIGAGQFARGALLPALRGVKGAVLRVVATSTGVTGEHIARKYGMAYCTTDEEGWEVDKGKREKVEKARS
jgi:hypothetical protein